jgi:very-short-patch-repair endonuclease
LIVAGDDKQLPPTNFFNRADVESEDDDDIADFESILSLCKSINMPSKRLRWHYRSRREPLIAFSNRHFYSGDLVTFPSVKDASSDAVRLELVEDGRWVDRRNLQEAERVVDLVIDHHRLRPDTSIGVIAFNQSQQRAIEDTLYDRRRLDPEIDALFDIGVTERMFIKNLENVQGDERDVIVLSMGYGFNDVGKFNKNFGPLTKAGGQRRLNVAVTRAREEVIFVASVRAAGMDLSTSKSEGAHLLKAYLEYAERGVDTLATMKDELAGETESMFEAEVAAALIDRGLKPQSQIGCGGFRIDLALTHPERPGEYSLGIECDGATYHSSQTARDRDRIRQSVLEALGWRIVRVWSTDWVRDPAKQVERILEAYDRAVACSDRIVSVDNDSEEDDLQPQFIKQDKDLSGPTFANIDEVPETEITAAAETVLVQAGATEFDDLVKFTSRELGFARVGSKIKKRLENRLGKDLKSGHFKQIGERISLSG